MYGSTSRSSSSSNASKLARRARWRRQSLAHLRRRRASQRRPVADGGELLDEHVHRAVAERPHRLGAQPERIDALSQPAPSPAARSATRRAASPRRRGSTPRTGTTRGRARTAGIRRGRSRSPCAERPGAARSRRTRRRRSTGGKAPRSQLTSSTALGDHGRTGRRTRPPGSPSRRRGRATASTRRDTFSIVASGSGANISTARSSLERSLGNPDAASSSASGRHRNATSSGRHAPTAAAHRAGRSGRRSAARRSRRARW